MPCAANISTAQLWDLPLPLPALEFAFFCHLDWSGHFFSCARLERCPRNGEILARLLRHRSTIEIRLALNFASANAASASFSTLPPPTQHRLTLNFASANAASAWLFSDFRRDHGDSGRFFCSVFEHLDGMNRCRAGLHVPGNILVACLLPRRSISMPLTEQLSVSVSIIWRQLLQ